MTYKINDRKHTETIEADSTQEALAQFTDETVYFMFGDGTVNNKATYVDGKQTYQVEKL